MAENPDAPLTTEELSTLERLLSNPLYFPNKFKSWLPDYVAQQIPQLPVVQSLGGRGIPRFLSSDTTPVNVGSTTTETEIYTTTVPGKRLAQNGQLKVRLYFRAMCTDVSNLLVVYINLNGTRAATMQELDTDDYLDGNNRNGMYEFTIFNLGSYSSQGIAAVGGFDAQAGPRSLGGAGSSSTDTTEEFTVSLSAQWAGSGAQLFTKYYASTELFNPIGVS